MPQPFIIHNSAQHEELARAHEELSAECKASKKLRDELSAARHQAAARSEELEVAVNALGEARQQLTAREREASHWRAESARAVSRLEALTAHCEGQAEQIRALMAEMAAQRKALTALRDQSELQHNALLASEVARAEQSGRENDASMMRPVGLAELHPSERPAQTLPPPPPPPSTPQTGTAAFVEVLATSESRQLRPPPRGQWGRFNG